jgi:RES domain-containing protein
VRIRGMPVRVRHAFLVQLDVPASVWRKRRTLTASSLDPAWAAEPPGITSQQLGQEWISGLESALLLVPSVIVPGEYNALVNPAHPDSRKITAKVRRHFIHDPRLR